MYLEGSSFIAAERITIFEKEDEILFLESDAPNYIKS